MKYWKLIGVMTTSLLFSNAYAANWVAALSVGGSLAQPGKSQSLETIVGSNGYINDSKLQTNLLAGAFVGLDFSLSPLLNYQVGLSYSQILPYSLNGQIQQLNNPNFNGFNYHYQIQSQQVFLDSKLLFNATKHLHPYVWLGLGTAFNSAYDFTATPAQDTAAGDPGIFSNHSNTNFAYAVGLGIDMDVAKHVRLGGGYRFANLGKATLGAAPDFAAKTGLSTSLYAHEIIMTATYIF